MVDDIRYRRIVDVQDTFYCEMAQGRGGRKLATRRRRGYIGVARGNRGGGNGGSRGTDAAVEQ